MIRTAAAFAIISLLFSAAGASDSLFKGARNVQLDNGLHVVIKEDHTHPIVSVQVWVRTGSVNENDQTAGLSHFLEHLIFKGTDKYPGQEISYRVETQGGVINAATSKEFTHFYIDIQTGGWQEAVKILADAMANAIFPADEIEKERPVVIEEIRRHFDNPGSLLYDLYSEAVFPKTPYRSSIIGTEKVIRSVSRDEIAGYYHAHYVPSNMYVSIAGDIRTDEAIALLKSTFGTQKKGTAPRDPGLIEPQHDAHSRIEGKDVEHVYWMAGFIGPAIDSDDQFIADITGTILGGGRSSRLYRVLREEKQLCYSISSSFWTQRGSGSMTVSMICPPEKRKEAADEIDRQFERLMREGPDDAELKRAKALSKSQWYFGRETAHEQASMLGYWWMQGNPGMVDRYIEGIEKVRREDVMDFLSRYYRRQGFSQAALVPKTGQ